MKHDPAIVLAAAAAIANARAGRRGAPPIANVMDILPPKLKAEVLEDAKAVLTAVEEVMKPMGDKLTKATNALVGLVGASTHEELDAMELVIRTMPAPESDRIASLNAIDALRDCLPLKTEH